MMNSIVLYYTWSGKTREMAQIICELTGADKEQIVPQIPYSSHYSEVVNQAKKEIKEGHLPFIQAIDIDFNKYDVIYIGTPIWWGTMAPPVATFLSQTDLHDKIIMPFSTHGGGGKGHADRDIKNLCKGAEVKDMFTAYEGGGRLAKRDIGKWIDESGLK